MVRDSSTVSWRHTCQTWCPRGHRPAPNSGHSPRACSGEPEATQSRWAQRKRDWLLLGTSRLATPAPASLRLPLNSIRRAPIGCGGFSSSPLQYGSPRSSAARPGNWPGLVSGRRWLASGCPLKWKLCRVGWKHTAAPHCEFGALTRKEDHLASRGDRVSGASIWPVPPMRRQRLWCPLPPVPVTVLPRSSQARAQRAETWSARPARCSSHSVATPRDRSRPRRLAYSRNGLHHTQARSAAELRFADSLYGSDRQRSNDTHNAHEPAPAAR